MAFFALAAYTRDVNEFLVGLLWFLSGVAIGIVTYWLMSKIGKKSQNSSSSSEEDEELFVKPGVVDVLRILGNANLIVDSVNGVIRANPEAYAYSLVRGQTLQGEDLIQLVEKVRTNRAGAEALLTVGDRESEGNRRLLSVKAATLDSEHILVLAEDQTAEILTEEVRNDFIANVSHELKTPVTAINLLAEALSENSSDPATVKKFSKKMLKESKRLIQLVQDVLEFSRVQANPITGDSDVVALTEVMSEAIERSSFQAEDKNINIVVGHIPNIYILGELDMLVTAVRNVIDNAVKYSPEGTQVSVNAKIDEETVSISVVDQGLGIEEEDQSRIFERFYRVDGDRSRKSGGSGLGLSIVNHVVRQHGGDISLWSVPGMGSTFTLTFPQFPEGEDTEEVSQMSEVGDF